MHARAEERDLHYKCANASSRASVQIARVLVYDRDDRRRPTKSTPVSVAVELVHDTFTSIIIRAVHCSSLLEELTLSSAQA
jgi:hypothetical protein